MKKPALIATITAGVILLGGGGYAIGTMNGNDTEAVTVATQAPSPEQPAAAAPEPTPTPTLSPTEAFIKDASRSFNSIDESYSDEMLNAVGQDICEYFATTETPEPYQVVESAQGTMGGMVYMDVWDAALFTPGYCD